MGRKGVNGIGLQLLGWITAGVMFIAALALVLTL